MKDTYFIPINSNSLAHYFSRAIILPAKYFANKPDDIQSRFYDSILVSKIKWIENSDCSIEVILTENESNELNSLTNNFYQCNFPIPISRIKSICFLDRDQKETTIWNINNGAAFVPENIVTIEQNRNIYFASESGIIENKLSLSLPEIVEKIKRYDIILGGFAFMKVGGKSFMNYSKNYFSTLSYFNKLIEAQTEKAIKEKGLDLSNKYIGLFLKNESEWTKWQQYIYQNVEADDIEYIAKQEKIKIEKKFGLIKLDSISPNNHLFDIAVLASYGDRKNKSVDDLVTDLENGTINQEKSEDISLLFGLNNGYAKFRNKYKTNNKEIPVKFRLDSKLDYYIIESIFQFVFNGNRNNSEFIYIDDWCIIKSSKNVFQGFETYNILDEVVVAKKKQMPLEIFLENYSNDLYATIAKTINQWLPPFAKSDEKEAIRFFDKALKGALSNSLEAFQSKIETECEANFKAERQELNISHKNEIDILKLEITNLKAQNRNKKNIDPVIVAPPSIIQSQREIETQKNEIEEQQNTAVVSEPEINISDNLQALSLAELKSIAKERNIRGYNKIQNKLDLINIIRNNPPLF